MLIPDKIGNGVSMGEVLVFNKFKKEKLPYYILHSVFLHDHIKNLSGEIDFLVIIPNKGVFCLEVKHGPVSRLNGQWKYKETVTGRGPFQQASEAMHSIRNWILENSGNKKNLKNILFGTGVIFSGVNSAIPLGVEGEQWQVLYRPDLINTQISRYLEELSENWHLKYQHQSWYDPQKARPSSADCDFLVKVIRGDFSRNYSALNEILDLNTQIESFTEQQLTAIEHVKYNERSVIEGYAGTGKTILSIELFKFYLENGLRIGFFCFNNRLGKVIQEKINSFFSADQMTGSFAGTFHSYLLSETLVKVPEEAEEQRIFFQNQLPMEFLLSLEKGDRPQFDLLIIDEAQDLITEDNLIIFNEILKKGIAQGNWIMAGDFYYQNLYQQKVDSLSLLREKSYFTRLKPLTINCRNTAMISRQNQLMTGVPYDHDGNFQVEGEEVDLNFLNESELAVHLMEVIKDYRNRNIPSSCISILTDRKPLKGSNKDILLQQIFNNHHIEISTVHGFKGLENDIVILLINGQGFEKGTLDLIYTGISRARIKLHLLFAKDMKTDYSQHIFKVYDQNKRTDHIRA